MVQLCWSINHVREELADHGLWVQLCDCDMHVRVHCWLLSLTWWKLQSRLKFEYSLYKVKGLTYMHCEGIIPGESTSSANHSLMVMAQLPMVDPTSWPWCQQENLPFKSRRSIRSPESKREFCIGVGSTDSNHCSFQYGADRSWKAIDSDWCCRRRSSDHRW